MKHKPRIFPNKQDCWKHYLFSPSFALSRFQTFYLKKKYRWHNETVKLAFSYAPAKEKKKKPHKNTKNKKHQNKQNKTKKQQQQQQLLHWRQYGKTKKVLCDLRANLQDLISYPIISTVLKTQITLDLLCYVNMTSF